MFGLLTSWRRYWSRGRKQIFQYWDGTAWRYADPMVIYRLLKEHKEFVWDRDPVLVSTGDMTALRVTASAVREAFGVVPFDGSTGRGLTESECLALLGEFATYLGGVKKNGSPSQTPPVSTDPPSSIDSTPAPNTNDSSVSGSTSTDRETGTPTP